MRRIHTHKYISGYRSTPTCRLRTARTSPSPLASTSSGDTPSGARKSRTTCVRGERRGGGDLKVMKIYLGRRYNIFELDLDFAIER